ncbi:MAG: PLD nuclease N-terminal domain-containing protein [Flavobacteriaceae bacterium]
MMSWPFIVLTTLALFLWTWAFVDLQKTNFKNSATRLLWGLGLFVFPIIGPLLYFQLKNKFILIKKRKFIKHQNTDNQ